jgi:serine/threonine protein kinase
MVGRTLSHYRIVSALGAGGMGTVYRAEDVRLGREVAVKVVSQDFVHDQQALQRLRSEARAASALNHPNICTIFDIGEDEGRPFIVMELMRGATLRDRLDSGRIKIAQLVDIGIEVADALHATHSDGIIHRDIKPGNIFVTDRGHVKLLDFGLAKLTEEFTGSPGAQETLDRTAVGVALGTISYMSPEQATGEPLDGRTDLFSLGVVLYECATGRHPFSAGSSAVTLAGILSRAPAAPISLNPDLPIRLQDIINNCLEKDRELRYQSAADLRADLKRLRRDLESGQSRTVETVSSATNTKTLPAPPAAPTTPVPLAVTAAIAPLDTTTAVGALDATTLVQPVFSASPSASGSASPPAAAPSSLTSPSPSSPASPQASPQASRLPLVISIGALVAVLAFGYVAMRPRAPGAVAGAPTPAPAVPVDAAALQNRLGLANASFGARNYRAAAAYAAEVLAIDPRQAQALSIRDESATMLARFDAAVADARQRLSSGDIQGAAQSLETARGLDPTAPSLIGLSARLSDAVRQRQTAGDRSASARGTTSAAAAPAARSAPASPAPPVVTIPVPAPPTVAAPTTVPAIPQPPPVVVPAPPTPPPAAVPPTVVPSTPAVTAPPPPAAPSGPTPEQDEAAIRRVTASYARAIETKDIGLFRTIKPNLSREEERRLQDGFRAVTSQKVATTILSIDRKGDEASVALRRRDTILAGGREQTAETQQTLRLTRAAGGWVIVEIR